MTQVESLEWSIKLWLWLADNPGKKKIDSPYPEVCGWTGLCPLCQYVKELHNGDSCAECPMAGGWPSSQGTQPVCGGRYSAYGNWERSLDTRKGLKYDVSFFALVLVEAYKERLEELK